MSLFELEAVGGPWGRRLAARREGFDELPWGQAREGASEAQIEAARWVWTQSAFSEYASAASFAEIACALLAAGAPVDLIAAAGDFVVDEVLHAELSARVAMALGGAIALEVDLGKLVRPPEAQGSLLRAAELLVRTSCVGEALTVGLLAVAQREAQTPLLSWVLGRILRDESQHAQLGLWFLDWAGERLSERDLDHLGAVAGEALGSFAPVLGGGCAPGAGLGVLDCASYDGAFVEAAERRVLAPLRERGLRVPWARP